MHFRQEVSTLDPSCTVSQTAFHHRLNTDKEFSQRTKQASKESHTMVSMEPRPIEKERVALWGQAPALRRQVLRGEWDAAFWAQ